MEQSPDAILAFDTAGVLLSANPASERMTGYSLDELGALSLLSLVAAEDGGQVQERFRLAAQGQPQHCEAAIITRAGERAELSLTFVSIAEAGGQDLVYLVGRDVTERRSAERAVRESEAHLRAILGQQAQLVQTIKALSTPVLPIHDRVLVVPLVGQLDAERGAQVTEALLAGIERQHAQMAILDITGVPIVDQETASHLLHATEAARLLGAQCLLVGVSPEVAQALVQVGASLDSLLTLRDLQAGIDYALSRYRRPALRAAAPG